MGALTVGYTVKNVKTAYGKFPNSLMIPIPSSSKRTKWGYGEVTDDTYQTLVLAESLITNKCINKKQLIQKFLDLPLKFNKYDSSTGKLRIDNNPNKFRFSSGNGGAMRISPLGMIYTQKTDLLEQVMLATQITHNGKSALAGATAIAFAISSIMAGEKIEDIINAAIEGAWVAQNYGEEDVKQLMFREIELACSLGYKNFRIQKDNFDNPDWGFKAIESIPFVISVFKEIQETKEGIEEIIKYGGDSDTLGSIMGVLCGTYNPDNIPEHIYNDISNVSPIFIEEIANKLTLLRLDIGSPSYERTVL